MRKTLEEEYNKDIHPTGFSILCSASLDNTQERRDNLEGDGRGTFLFCLIASQKPKRESTLVVLKVLLASRYQGTRSAFLLTSPYTHLPHQSLPSWRPLLSCGSPAHRKARDKVNKPSKQRQNIARHTGGIFLETFYSEPQFLICCLSHQSVEILFFWCNILTFILHSL